MSALVLDFINVLQAYIDVERDEAGDLRRIVPPPKSLASLFPAAGTSREFIGTDRYVHQSVLQIDSDSSNNIPHCQLP